jgi:glycine/serine hydroxymethyltransferase
MKQSKQTYTGAHICFILVSTIRCFICFIILSEYGVSSTHIYDYNLLMLVGNKVEKLCDLCSITLNKNAVFGDSSALSPGGVRIG